MRKKTPPGGHSGLATVRRRQVKRRKTKNRMARESRRRNRRK